MKKTVSWDGIPLDPNAVASPCGYISNVFVIKPTPISMTPSPCPRLGFPSTLTQQVSHGREIKDRNTRGLLIVHQRNGQTLKISTLLFGWGLQDFRTSRNFGESSKQILLQVITQCKSDWNTTQASGKGQGISF